jgi:hypothetical protein
MKDWHDKITYICIYVFRGRDDMVSSRRVEEARYWVRTQQVCNSLRSRQIMGWQATIGLKINVNNVYILDKH